MLKKKPMKKGDRVNLKGTKKEGVVIKTESKRDKIKPTYGAILFVTVDFGNSTMEFEESELRLIENVLI